MLDRRYKYKARQLQQFYLFVKHRNIIYAFFPEYKVTRSTGFTDIKNAYQKAFEIYDSFTEPKALYFTPTNKKRERELKHILSYFPKNFSFITSSMVSKVQQKMLADGKSAKTVNNYMSLLKSCYNDTFPPYKNIEGHKAVYRHCFPLADLYGLFSKCETRLHFLYFFAITSGCRLGEIKTVEFFEKNGQDYLQINGTKTENAVRSVPIIPETKTAFEKARVQDGFRSSAYKESVYEVGQLLGYDKEYVDQNNITFHTTRKVYKTLLSSIVPALPNNYVEMLIGHSQTSDVNSLYFDAKSMDDSELAPIVTKELGRLV